MKASQIFVIFALFISAQLLKAGGGSEESKHRRDTCGELVKHIDHSGESSGSHSGESSGSNEQHATPVNSASSVSVSYGTTKNGVCVCESTTEASEATESSETTELSTLVSGSQSSKKHPHVPSCIFTEAIWNISLTLSVEYQVILQQWIYEVEYTILIDYNLYTSDELVVLLAYSLKKFSLSHTEIWEIINFEYIAEWGYCIDFIYVAYEIQLEISSEIVVLDSSDNCQLFEAMRNATKGNSAAESDCEDMISELIIILKHSGWSYEQKLAAFYGVFQFYFESNSELKVLLIGCQIEGYGSFESFIDVCQIYERTTTISDVIGGSSSNCVVIKQLEVLYSNSSVELSVRNQIKQLHDKLVAYFDSTTDISLRLEYVSQQCYSFFVLVNFNVKIVNEIKLGSWGLFYDLLFCSHICTNNGCGNLNNGPGTEATTVGQTTVASTTQVVSSTIQPADCSKKNMVVAVNSDNTTYLINHLQANYNSWNSSTKTGFNSYFNQIKTYSYNFTMTIQQRVSSCVTALTNYNKNNVYARSLVWNITITEWAGTIGQLCSCS